LKNKVIRVLIIIFLLISSSVSYSQDPQFSQFYANSLYLNPAFAGRDMSPRFHSGYRNQWPGLDAYVTYNIEYDQFSKDLHGGIGFQFLYDKTGGGVLNTGVFAGCYAYQLQINRDWSLNFGFKGAFVQKSLNFNLATFGDQFDNSRGQIYSTNQQQGNNSSYFDFGSGLILYSKNIFGGVSFNHLTRPSESLYFNSNNDTRIPIRTTIHGGYKVRILKNGLFHKELFVAPNVLLDFQSNFKQLNFGSYFLDGIYGIGIWYRHTSFSIPNGGGLALQDGLILMGGIETSTMRICYSYDLSLSSMVSAAPGSHEISITFDLPEIHKPGKQFRVIQCPMF
jgi:type IX secretion system PorP/SprF family membrane protein